MKFRRRPSLTVVVIVLLLAAPAAAGAAPGQFVKAFTRSVRSAYPGAQGFRACPASTKARSINGGIWCQAEVHSGTAFHAVSSYASLSHGRVTFRRTHRSNWTRRWSSYSSGVIRGFHVPGVASVNGPDYDWRFIAAGAYNEGWKKKRASFSVWGCDCQSFGFQTLYSFKCRTGGPEIECTNALGDSIRYRAMTPRGRP